MTNYSEYYSLSVQSGIPTAENQLGKLIVSSGDQPYTPFLHTDPSILISHMLDLNLDQLSLSNLRLHSRKSSVQESAETNWKTITWVSEKFPNILVETSFCGGQLAFACFAVINQQLMNELIDTNTELSIEQFFDAQIPRQEVIES